MKTRLMRTLSYLIVLLIVMPFENVLAETTNVLMHLNDTAKLPHLTKNIANIRKGLGDDVNIQVVINGKAVTAMLSGNALAEEKVKNMLKNKAKIGLCHYAMSNNNVSDDHLIEGVSILPEGGIVTIIKLQQEGYIYIKI